MTGDKQAPKDAFNAFFKSCVDEQIGEYRKKNESLSNAYNTLNGDYERMNKEKDVLDGKYH